jgi:hypothetical protein
MIRLPTGESKKIPGLVALMDVGPTLLEQAGLRVRTGQTAVSLQKMMAGADGRAVVYSEGALRLSSVRSPHSRLIWEGFRPQNPFFGAALSVAPVNGAGLSLIGDSAEEPALRQALLDFYGKKP